MSADAIVAAIRSEADREVEAIMATARLEAERLLGDARATAARRVTEALGVAEPGLAADASRRLNVARLRLLHARASQRAERVAAVFEAARIDLAALAERGDPRWRAGVERLRASATAAVGSADAIVEEIPGSGVLARSADGRITVDATFQTRLDRARVLLADAVAEIVASP